MDSWDFIPGVTGGEIHHPEITKELIDYVAQKFGEGGDYRLLVNGQSLLDKIRSKRFTEEELSRSIGHWLTSFTTFIGVALTDLKELDIALSYYEGEVEESAIITQKIDCAHDLFFLIGGLIDVVYKMDEILVTTNYRGVTVINSYQMRCREIGTQYCRFRNVLKLVAYQAYEKKIIFLKNRCGEVYDETYRTVPDYFQLDVSTINSEVVSASEYQISTVVDDINLPPFVFQSDKERPDLGFVHLPTLEFPTEVGSFETLTKFIATGYVSLASLRFDKLVSPNTDIEQLLCNRCSSGLCNTTVSQVVHPELSHIDHPYQERGRVDHIKEEEESILYSVPLVVSQQHEEIIHLVGESHLGNASNNGVVTDASGNILREALTPITRIEFKIAWNNLAPVPLNVVQKALCVIDFGNGDVVHHYLDAGPHGQLIIQYDKPGLDIGSLTLPRAQIKINGPIGVLYGIEISYYFHKKFGRIYYNVKSEYSTDLRTISKDVVEIVLSYYHFLGKQFGMLKIPVNLHRFGSYYGYSLSLPIPFKRIFGPFVERGGKWMKIKNRIIKKEHVMLVLSAMLQSLKYDYDKGIAFVNPRAPLIKSLAQYKITKEVYDYILSCDSGGDLIGFRSWQPIIQVDLPPDIGLKKIPTFFY